MIKRNVNYLKETIGLILLLFKLIIPLRKFKILSIYFHNPPPILFEKIIIYLINNKYTIISLKQLSDIIYNKRMNGKIAVITIDDGWQNNLGLLDLIRKYKVPVAIFVTTSAIEEGNFWFEYVGRIKNQKKASIKRDKVRIKKLDYENLRTEICKLKASLNLYRTVLTKDELIQLSKEPFITIGSHTVNHLSLPYSRKDVQQMELLNSKLILETWTGQKIIYFSYPMGDYTDDLKVLTKECGYKLCFSTETDHIELSKLDGFLIPRRCVNDDAGYFEALSKIFGIWYKIKN